MLTARVPDLELDPAMIMHLRLVGWPRGDALALGVIVVCWVRYMHEMRSRSNGNRIGSVRNGREKEAKMAAVEVRAPKRMPTQANTNRLVRDRYIDATMTRGTESPVA